MVKVITKLNFLAKKALGKISGYLEANGKIIAYNNKKEAISRMKVDNFKISKPAILGNSFIDEENPGLSITKIAEAPIGTIIIKWIRGKKEYTKKVEVLSINKQIIIHIKKSGMLIFKMLGLGWRFNVKVK